MESAAFAPFILLAAILTDIFVAGVHHSLYVTVAAEFLLTMLYVGLASYPRYKLKFSLKEIKLSSVVALLIFRGAVVVSILLVAVYL